MSQNEPKNEPKMSLKKALAKKDCLKHEKKSISRKMQAEISKHRKFNF